jgi:hypothetical protein
MQEIIYLVTRDTEKAEAEISPLSVALWGEKDDAKLAVSGAAYEGSWYVDRIGEAPIDELTPVEFREQYGIAAPKPGEKFYMRSICNWEVVDEQDD